MSAESNSLNSETKCDHIGLCPLSEFIRAIFFFKLTISLFSGGYYNKIILCWLLGIDYNQIHSGGMGQTLCWEPNRDYQKTEIK
jgi:hypothetical protein